MAKLVCHEKLPITKDSRHKYKNVLPVHTKKGCSRVPQLLPVLQNQSQRHGWWNRDHLLADSRGANCPPTNPLSSIRQALLSLGFCDAVGWKLQFSVHLPVTFYTSLVTEFSFFLGCLSRPYERSLRLSPFWCAVKEILSKFSIGSIKIYFQWKCGWKMYGLALLQGGHREADSMLICWDKSTGPSWTLMNSSEQDYRTPGAAFAQIPAMRESFIGCSSRQCQLILNAGFLSLETKPRVPPGKEQSPCVQTTRAVWVSEYVLVNRMRSSAGSAASRSNCHWQRSGGMQSESTKCSNHYG